MSRSVLRQFFLAVLLLGTYFMILSISGYDSMPFLAAKYGPLPIAVLKWIPRTLMDTLPFAGGIALALLPMRAGAFKQAALLIGSITILMVLNDTALRPAWDAYDRVTTTPDSAERARPHRFDDTTGAISGSWAHLMGRVKASDIRKWPPENSTSNGNFSPIRSEARIVRMSATYKYNALTNMLLPFIGGGLVLGLGAWLTRAVTFRKPRDERIFRLCAAWVLVPAAVMFVMATQRGMWYDLSSERSWLGWLFLPVLAGGVPACLGWRAVYRLDTLAAE